MKSLQSFQKFSKCFCRAEDGAWTEAFLERFRRTRPHSLRWSGLIDVSTSFKTTTMNNNSNAHSNLLQTTTTTTTSQKNCQTRRAATVIYRSTRICGRGTRFYCRRPAARLSIPLCQGAVRAVLTIAQSPRRFNNFFVAH